MSEVITNKSMFELHDVELTLKIQEIDDRLKLVTRARAKLLIWFKYNNYSIRKMEFNKKHFIDHKILSIALPIYSIDKYYNIQLNSFYEFNKEYFKLIKDKENLINLKINEKIFTSILIKFNTKLGDSIIEDDYNLKHHYLGNIGKHLNKSPRLTVDWSTSNKNKQKLLEEGRIPELKVDRELAKEKGEEYKGESWLAYNSPYNFYFKWTIEYYQSIKFFNMKNYQFIPYRGEKSPTAKLYAYRNTFTEEQLINNYNSLKNAN